MRPGAVAVGRPGAAPPRSRTTGSAAVRFLSPLRGGGGRGREGWAWGGRIGPVCVPASRLQQVVVARCGRFPARLGGPAGARCRGLAGAALSPVRRGAVAIGLARRRRSSKSPGVRRSGFCPRFAAGEGVVARRGRGGAGSGRFASPLRGFNRWWSRGVDVFLPPGWAGPGARCRALAVRRGAVAVGPGPAPRATSKSPDPECAVRFLSPLRGGGGCGREAVGVGGPDRAGLRPRFAASTGGGREVWTLSCPPGSARHPPPGVRRPSLTPTPGEPSGGPDRGRPGHGQERPEDHGLICARGPAG